MLQKTSMMFLLILSFFAAAAAQTPHLSHGAGGAADGMAFYSISELKWKDGPGSLAAGAKFAVLEGDPTKEGLFVMRLLPPDGFKVAPHWHPMAERVTVLQGTFYLGTGEKFDMSAGREMPAGTYGHWPAGMKHLPG